MFFWWGPGWGWLAGLISAGLWILIIIGAIVLLRRELPDLQHRFSAPPALRVLEERYAKGEITREEFLHRREVLLTANLPPYPPPSSQAPPPPAPAPSATPPSGEPTAAPPQAPPAEAEPAGDTPPADQGDGAMSSTYEPPRAPSAPQSAEPTQPLSTETPE